MRYRRPSRLRRVAKWTALGLCVANLIAWAVSTVFTFGYGCRTERTYHNVILTGGRFNYYMTEYSSERNRAEFFFRFIGERRVKAAAGLSPSWGSKSWGTRLDQYSKYGSVPMWLYHWSCSSRRGTTWVFVVFGEVCCVR